MPGSKKFEKYFKAQVAASSAKSEKPADQTKSGDKFISTIKVIVSSVQCDTGAAVGSTKAVWIADQGTRVNM